MTTQFVESLINSKMNINQNEIIFTFYELRVKHNLTEEQTDEFLALCKTRLENLYYKVFFTGAKSSSLFPRKTAISSKNSKASKINDSNL